MREIERKFIAPADMCQAQVDYILKRTFNPEREVYGSSKDYFFSPGPMGSADFIRCRQASDGTTEVTAKTKDQGTNLNRLEINLTAPSPIAGLQFCREVLGSPITTLEKVFTQFKLYDGAEISTSIIRGQDVVIVEFEANNIARVNELVEDASKYIELKEETRSIYEMFVQPWETIYV